MDRGVRREDDGNTLCCVKKKKTMEEGGAGLEGERREGFTVPGVAQILRQRNTRERLRWGEKKASMVGGMDVKEKKKKKIKIPKLGRMRCFPSAF